MYYISRKEFQKVGKFIYKRLFSGFTIYDCHFKNKENKYKEHFSEPKMWEDLGVSNLSKEEEEKKKECIIAKLEAESEVSKTYKMSKEARMFHIFDALAIVYGFKSFFDYKNKTKFKKDIKKLIPMDEMPHSEYITINTRLQNELIKSFCFKKEVDLIIPSFLLKSRPEIKNSLINESYKTKDEFYNALAYMYGSYFMTVDDLELLSKGDNWDDVKKTLIYHTSLNIEQDLYEHPNDKKEFLRRAAEYYPEKDFSFINKINNTYEIARITENIATLSEEDFEIFQEVAKKTFYPETVYLFELIRKQEKNEYMKFLFKLEKEMKVLADA